MQDINFSITKIGRKLSLWLGQYSTVFVFTVVSKKVTLSSALFRVENSAEGVLWSGVKLEQIDGPL